MAAMYLPRLPAGPLSSGLARRSKNAYLLSGVNAIERIILTQKLVESQKERTNLSDESEAPSKKGKETIPEKMYGGQAGT